MKAPPMDKIVNKRHTQPAFIRTQIIVQQFPAGKKEAAKQKYTQVK